MEIESYAEIHSLGHRDLAGFFERTVLVEEKVDGSQISFMTKNDRLYARSRTKMLDVDRPEGLFKLAIESIHEMWPDLRTGWIYRGEFLAEKRHNVLAYNRTPANHIMIYDVQDASGSFLPYEAKYNEAMRLGLETVQVMDEVPAGMLKPEDLAEYLTEVSVLGGCLIEGVVFKPILYDFKASDGKMIFAKHVGAAFKEKMDSGARPQKDFLMELAAVYSNPARWAKAVQHLQEAGGIKEEMRDIGAIVHEVQIDVMKEAGEEISTAVLDWGLPQIVKNLSKVDGGIANWYKERLAAKTFDTGGSDGID